MKVFLKQNAQFLLLVFSWIVAGHILKELADGLVILTFLLLKNKIRYAELVIAFCFLLFLGDNRHHEYDFARDTKDIVLILLSIFVLFDKKHFPQQSRLFYPFIAFLVLSLVMCYRHPTPFLSFQKTISYILLFTVIPNYFIKLLNENGARFFHTFFMFFGLVLFIGLTMIIWNNHDVFLAGRFNGLLGNPNGIGSYCTVFSILLAAALFHYPNFLSRSELYFVIAVVALSVIFSSSRNAIFSIMIFLFFRRFYKISSLIGFVIVIVSALLFQIVSQYLPTIISSLGLGSYFRVEHLDDGSGRLLAWKFGWDEIQSNFLFGRGFAYEEYYFFINKEMLSDLGHQGGIHNTYLSTWLNTGLVGLLFFIFGLTRSFFKAASNSYLALPALFAILFSIMFESWFVGSLNPFTILALFAITTLQHKKIDRAEKEKSPIPLL